MWVTRYSSGEYRRYGWVCDGTAALKPDLEWIHMARDIKAEDLKQILLKLFICRLTADKESGAHYDSFNAYDGAGLSYGLFHWTLHAGECQKVLWYFYQLDPDGFNETLGKKFRVEKHYGKYVLVNDRDSVIDLVKFRRFQMVKQFVLAGRKPAMKLAQHKAALKWFDKVQRGVAAPYGFKDPLALAVLLSLSVVWGRGGCRRRLKESKVEDQKGTEWGRLFFFIDYVKKHYKGKRARINHVLKYKNELMEMAGSM